MHNSFQFIHAVAVAQLFHRLKVLVVKCFSMISFTCCSYQQYQACPMALFCQRLTALFAKYSLLLLLASSQSESRLIIVTSSSVANADYMSALCIRRTTLEAIHASRLHSDTCSFHLHMAELLVLLRTIFSVAMTSRL